MADYLRIEHWLDRLLAALRANDALIQRGYRLVEIGDLRYGFQPPQFAEQLPVLLAWISEDITPEDMDLHGDAERYAYPVRVVALHSFAEADRVLALKSAVLGELQAAVRAVQYDATVFEAPTAEHQFHYMEPEGFELQPEEEDLLQGDDGHKNIFAVAVRYRLIASSRVER